MNNIENGQSAAEQGYQMKDIPGWEGLYACTTHGDIWSHRSDKFYRRVKIKEVICMSLLLKMAKDTTIESIDLQL